MNERLPQASGGLSNIKDVTTRDALLRMAAFMPSYLGLLAADPDTSTWGEENAGVFWWNTAARSYKHWSGIAVVVGL